jgi:hypothetical protein
LGSSQKMCLTRFLSSAEDACNACCLISPQRPICAPQLAQVTALCSASSGSTTSARQPHLTQRRSNGTGNESIGEYAFQTATRLVLAKGLRASFGYFLGLGFLWQRGLPESLQRATRYIGRSHETQLLVLCAPAYMSRVLRGRRTKHETARLPSWTKRASA